MRNEPQHLRLTDCFCWGSQAHPNLRAVKFPTGRFYFGGCSRGSTKPSKRVDLKADAGLRFFYFVKTANPAYKTFRIKSSNSCWVIFLVFWSRWEWRKFNLILSYSHYILFDVTFDDRKLLSLCPSLKLIRLLTMKFRLNR